MQITPARVALAAAVTAGVGTAAYLTLRNRHDAPKEGLTPGVPTYEPVGGNDAQLLVDYREFLPSVFRDLRSAQHVINIVEYNWEPTGPGRELADILKERARAGVEVNVMTDKRGSMGVDSNTPADEERRYFADLEAAGVNVIVTDPGGNVNPFGLKLDHRKFFDIDHRVSYVGGLGIAGDEGGKYYDWHDLMLRTEGPAAAHAGAEFIARWQEQGGAVSTRQTDAFEAAKVAARAVAGDAEVQLLPNTPGVGLDATEDFFAAASSDSSRLWTMTPYIGDRQVQEALVEAARAGKDVRVLVPGPESGSNGPQLKISRTFYRDLVEAGAKVYEFPRMMHAKLWMTDERVTVGSTNLSDGSLDEYLELSVGVEDAATMQKTERMFLADIAESRQLTLDDFDRSDRAWELVRELSHFEF